MSLALVCARDSSPNNGRRAGRQSVARSRRHRRSLSVRKSQSSSGSAKTPLYPEVDDRDQYGWPKAEEQAHRSIERSADEYRRRDVIGTHETASRTRIVAAEVSDNLGQWQGLRLTVYKSLVVLVCLVSFPPASLQFSFAPDSSQSLVVRPRADSIDPSFPFLSLPFSLSLSSSPHRERCQRQSLTERRSRILPRSIPATTPRRPSGGHRS
jgi:hypothetical protein